MGFSPANSKRSSPDLLHKKDTLAACLFRRNAGGNIPPPIFPGVDAALDTFNVLSSANEARRARLIGYLAGNNFAGNQVYEYTKETRVGMLFSCAFFYYLSGERNTVDAKSPNYPLAIIGYYKTRCTVGVRYFSLGFVKIEIILQSRNGRKPDSEAVE